MAEILRYFNEFKKQNQELFINHDGINGDCKLFARELYHYYSELGFKPDIYTLNNGVHYWIKVDKVCIDCRGVFVNEQKCLAYFKRYVVKIRITRIYEENVKEEKIVERTKNIPKVIAKKSDMFTKW